MIPKQDILALKGEIKANLHAFAVKVFEGYRKYDPHFNDDKAYYVIPTGGRFSCTIGAFFPEGQPRGKNSIVDHIELWMILKEQDFKTAYKEIRKWLDNGEAKKELEREEQRAKKGFADAKEIISYILFAFGEPDQIKESASTLVKRVNKVFKKEGFEHLQYTTKEFAKMLRRWGKEQDAFVGKQVKHFWVDEVIIGKDRSDQGKGTKSKFVLTKATEEEASRRSYEYNEFRRELESEFWGLPERERTSDRWKEVLRKSAEAQLYKRS